MHRCAKVLVGAIGLVSVHNRRIIFHVVFHQKSVDSIAAVHGVNSTGAVTSLLDEVPQTTLRGLDLDRRGEELELRPVNTLSGGEQIELGLQRTANTSADMNGWIVFGKVDATPAVLPLQLVRDRLWVVHTFP